MFVIRIIICIIIIVVNVEKHLPQILVITNFQIDTLWYSQIRETYDNSRPASILSLIKVHITLEFCANIRWKFKTGSYELPGSNTVVVDLFCILKQQHFVTKLYIFVSNLFKIYYWKQDYMPLKDKVYESLFTRLVVAYLFYPKLYKIIKLLSY